MIGGFFWSNRRALAYTLCLHVSLLQSTQDSFLYKPLNEKNIQQASRELTEKESVIIKEYLQKRLEDIKNNVKINLQTREQEQLESIVKEFYRGRYDLVMQGMYALGYDPQKILGITRLRTSMLSGNLEHTPWFLREIAGLDWFFERDSKRSRKNMRWPQLQDKMSYLFSLADQLEKNYTRIIDKKMVCDAVDSLIMHINMLMKDLTSETMLMVHDVLKRLENVRNATGCTVPPLRK